MPEEFVTKIESTELHPRHGVIIMGSRITRKEADATKTPYAIACILAMRLHPSRGVEFYLQKRDNSKKVYPGMRTFTASGGENAELDKISQTGAHTTSIKKAMIRELDEEQWVRPRRLQFLTPKEGVALDDNNLHRKFFVGLAVVSRKPADKPGEPVEVDRQGSKWLTLSEINKLITNGKLTPPAAKFFKQLQENGKLKQNLVKVSKANLDEKIKLSQEAPLKHV